MPGRDPLPRPVTTDQLYLSAILDELRALAAELGKRPENEAQTDAGLVELKEPAAGPAPAPARKGKK